MHIFLDESGCLGFDFENKNPSPFFAITILVCENRQAVFAFKSAVRRTLVAKINRKKNKKAISELKGVETTQNNKKFFYKQVQQYVSKEDWQLYSIVVDKKLLLKKTQSKINTHRLYNLLSKEILECVNLSSEKSSIHLTVDKFKNNRERTLFDNFLKAHLEPKLPFNVPLNISHEKSDESAGLQAVDLFCYGIIRKYGVKDNAWYSEFSDQIKKEIEWMPKKE